MRMFSYLYPDLYITFPDTINNIYLSVFLFDLSSRKSHVEIQQKH